MFDHTCGNVCLCIYVSRYICMCAYLQLCECLICLFVDYMLAKKNVVC